jgi:hypothetical protein
MRRSSTRTYSYLALLVVVALLIIECKSILHIQADDNRNLEVRGKSRIGAVEAYYRPEEAAEANLGSERIIFEWRNFQPDGPQDWVTNSIPAKWIENANKNGRIVVGLIKNAPNWATGSHLFGATPKGLELPLDDPNNYWAAFVRKLTQYYSTFHGGVHHWIIYNEPDIRPNAEKDNFFEFAGTIQEYYKVLKTAYKVAHATDSKAVIHLAGLTYWHDIAAVRPLYLERLLRIMTSDPEARENNLFFDILTVHAFNSTHWVWFITRRFKLLTEGFGYPKPVWINEMNALVTKDDGYPYVQNRRPQVTLDDQARFIIQGTALGLAAGADQVQVYKLFDNDMTYEPWGVIRGDGTPRPSYYALKTASEYFGNTISAQRVKNSYATMVTLAQVDKTIYVMWSMKRFPVTLRVNAAAGTSKVQLVSKVGEVTDVPRSKAMHGYYEFKLEPCTGSCEIDGEPIILIQPGTPQPGWTIVNGTLSPLASYAKE